MTMTTRRGFLFLLGGSAVAATTTVAEATGAELRFNELYEREAVLTDKCRDLTGKNVTMTGFMAPPLKAEARFFVLTGMPMSICPFCESEAQWPDNIVLVTTDEPVRAIPFNRPIKVTGVLETGFAKDPETGFVSLIRLVDAGFERL
jgi:hypothetical protein